MAAPPVENPIILNLTDTFGCMLVGTFLAAIVWGMSSLQTQVHHGLLPSQSDFS